MKKLNLLFLFSLLFAFGAFACPHEKIYKESDLIVGSEGWYHFISMANGGTVVNHYCEPTTECVTCDCNDQIATGGDPTDQTAADYLFGLADVDMFAGDFDGTYTAAFQPEGEAVRHYQVVMYFDNTESEVHQVFSRID